MSKKTTKREAIKLGQRIAASLVLGGVVSAEQAKSATIIVDDHKKHLRTEPRKPTNNKRWKRHCHHPAKNR